LKFRSVLGGCLVVVAAATTGWAQTQQQPPPRPVNPNTPGLSNPQGVPTPSGPGQAVDPNKYSIGAEDVLFIQTWREPDFTFVKLVRPDGKITIPLIGDVQAGGMTPIQLTKELTEKLANYVNRPDVTVTVQEVRSKKYYVDGEVGRPGEYPLITPTKVLEAISKAGGFKEFANQKAVLILRGSKTFKFNYKEVIHGKKLEQNILLDNGDHIIVH
jgi:polysaccharide export outer membrane protein